MNTIIIQPTDPHPPIANREGFSAAENFSFSPSFDLLSLNSHININSRHKSVFIDMRTLADPVTALLDEVDNTPKPRTVVIETRTKALRYTVNVIRLLRQSFDDLRIGICGQHPTDYPKEALAINFVDFAMSGDAEPILKQYLDYIDLPQRLAKIPGLQIVDSPVGEPSFVSNIGNMLTTPSWATNFWANYRVDGNKPICEATIRTTRGNTGLPPDRAHPEWSEPLRYLDFKMLSSLMERCSAVSVNHVNVVDPPGVWTQDYLIGWCNALADFHVRQAWGLQLLPSGLSKKEHAALYEAWCKRVSFIFPSCDPEILEKYGVHLDLNTVKETIKTLKKHRISPLIQYWIGGPEAGKNEVALITSTIRELGFCDFILRPFPLHFDSTVYEECAENMPSPGLNDYLEWAAAPEEHAPPPAVWGGQDAIPDIQSTAARILRKINRSPKRVLKRMREQVTHTPWIEKLETKSASIDVIGPPTRDP